MGISGVPATRFEAACASSGSAFFHAVSAVAAGLYDVVLVVGVEKMTSQPTPKVTEILAGAGDSCGEVRAGATFPALFAMIARRHMYQYGTTREQLAAVAVKNHQNGAKNPLAHMRKVITMEQALKGKMIAEPLTVYDCSLISDGAAAVLITPLERAAEFTDKPVRVLGIAQTSDNVALDEKDDITTLRAVKTSAAKAYKMAGVEAADIQFAEVHDCFTIAEIIAIEDLGFVPKGEGGPYSLGRRNVPAWRAAGECERRFEIERASRGRYGHGADLRCCGADSRTSGRAAGEAEFAWAGAESRWIGRYQRDHDPGGGMSALSANDLQSGTVYTETVVYSPPEAYVNDVPYQLAIIELAGGRRLTGRVDGERVQIGDRVQFAEFRNNVPFFRKQS